MRGTSAQRSALIGHPRIVGHRPPHSIHRRNAIVDDAVLACARRRADRLTRRPSAASRTSRASLQRHRARRTARTGKTTPRSRSSTASRASRTRRVREASLPPPARHPPAPRGASPTSRVAPCGTARSHRELEYKGMYRRGRRRDTRRYGSTGRC
jgi:hypothetical protein